MKCDLQLLKKRVLNHERLLIEVKGTYGAKQGLKRRQDFKEKRNDLEEVKAKKPCRYYAAGNCEKGSSCTFAHQVATKANKTVEAKGKRKPTQEKEPAKDKKQPAQKDLKYLKEKCTRSHAEKDLAEHPAFSCQDSKTYCQACKKTGHTADRCPDRTCDACKEKGHSTRVHGWSTSQIFH